MFTRFERICRRCKWIISIRRQRQMVLVQFWRKIQTKRVKNDVDHWQNTWTRKTDYDNQLAKKKKIWKKRRNSIEKKKQNKHSSGCDTRTHTATTESFSGAVVKGECFMANNHFKSNIIINWRSNWIRKNRLKMGIERRNDHAILHGNRLQHIAKIT